MDTLLLLLYNFKTVLYLLLGTVSCRYVYNKCERHARSKIETVNPWLWFIMAIWGASGLFFLRFLSLLLPDSFNPFLRIVYTAVPDWDLLFHTWTKWDWLNHPSWLFNSVILPTGFLFFIILLLPKSQKRLSNKTRQRLNSLRDIARDIAIGLYIGISTHLMVDVLLFWVPGGDNYNFFAGLGELDSMIWMIWLVFNIFLGFSIPFLIMTSKNPHVRSKFNRKVRRKTR